jgi:hypothetical protein
MDYVMNENDDTMCREYVRQSELRLHAFGIESYRADGEMNVDCLLLRSGTLVTWQFSVNCNLLPLQLLKTALPTEPDRPIIDHAVDAWAMPTRITNRERGCAGRFAIDFAE